MPLSSAVGGVEGDFLTNIRRPLPFTTVRLSPPLPALVSSIEQGQGIGVSA